MILGMVSREEHAMSPYFFQQDLWLNAAGYTVMLEEVVVSCIDLACKGRLYVFHQDSPPAQKAVVTPDWMVANLPDYITTNMCSPNSPNLNQLDY